MKNILTLFLLLSSLCIAFTQRSFDFQITSMDGKMIKKGVSTKEINVSDLPNGLFLLKIQRQGDVFIEKFVVEK
jgi:hypothetical protein